MSSPCCTPFGRSANVVASLPYAVGNFQGRATGAETHLYRSGLLDSAFRLSVNLKGGPAMPPQKFIKWKQKMLLGASLRVAAPTGWEDLNSAGILPRSPASRTALRLGSDIC